MYLKSKVIDRQQLAERLQQLIVFCPRQTHLAASYVGDFVQRLHADHAALPDNCFGLISFCRVS